MPHDDHPQTPSGPTPIARDAAPGASPAPADRRALLAGLGGLAAGALLAGARTAHAGPLDPPIGPIAPTQKPLAEVEPRIAINAANTPGDASSLFRITLPGSYYLTGNIFGSAGRSGISVDSLATRVTIDLNGFALFGIPGAGKGVFVSAGTVATLRNGTVSNWPNGGVEFLEAGGILEHVRVLSNGVGIRAAANTLVKDCVARNNTGIGIDVLNDGVVVNCTAVNNSSFGISAGGGTIIDACTLSGNLGGGARLVENAVLRNSTLLSNNLHGATVGNSCAVLGNLFINNPAGLLITGTDTRVEGNQFLRSSASAGLRVTGNGNFILRNIASGNVTNWDIAPGNAVAPIVLASTNAAAINGNIYAGPLGSTDPHANFTY